MNQELKLKQDTKLGKLAVGLSLAVILIFSGITITAYHKYSLEQRIPPIGKLLPGWPIKTDGKGATIPYPRLFDIDQDKNLELIAVTGQGTVYICEASGDQTEGWPRNYALSSTEHFFPDTFIADFLPLNPGMELGFYQILENNTSYFFIADLTGTILGDWFYPNMSHSLAILLTKENHPPVMCFWNMNSTTSQVILHSFQDTKTTIKNIIIDPQASLITANSFRDPITGEDQLLFLSSSNTIYHVDRTGRILHHWSHPSICIGNERLITIFALEFEYEGEVTFFWVNGTGQMLAWDAHGLELDSWHQNHNMSFLNLSLGQSFYITRFPIAADLNKDGVRELITSWGSGTGLIIIFRADGFPGYILYSNKTNFWYTPLIADFNQDMTYELLVFGRYGGFHFYLPNGTDLEGNDVYPIQEIYKTVLLGDITGDNFCELFFTSLGGEIYAYTTHVVGRALWTESSRLYVLTDFWDRDYDGLIDKDEKFWKTDPLSNDTDADGLTDLEEIGISFTNPLTANSPLDDIWYRLFLPYGAHFGRIILAIGFASGMLGISFMLHVYSQKKRTQ
ncbi:MAG: hypothetical protein ACFE95_07125 [Candidatus Hodarchaeota archaeon]